MRHLRSLIVLAALGCGGITEPDSPGFEFREAKVFGVRRSPPNVAGGDGFIDVSGIFEVPHPNFTITGWLTIAGARSLQLAVRGNPDSDGMLVSSLHLFTSRISRLPKGTYQLELIYVLNKGALRDSNLVYATSVAVR